MTPGRRDAETVESGGPGGRAGERSRAMRVVGVDRYLLLDGSPQFSLESVGV